MNFPEQADPSAEHTEKSALYEYLSRERDAAGSTREYLQNINAEYVASPAHRPNMLQLKRTAEFMTNPVHEPTFPMPLTDAFYWGEVLAYKTQQQVIGDEWSKVAHKVISEVMVDALYTMHDDTVPQSENLLQIADQLMTVLADADGHVMPPALDRLAIEWAGSATNNDEAQWYMALGFRSVIMAVIKKSEEDELKQVKDSAVSLQQLLDTPMEMQDVPIETAPFDTRSITVARHQIMESYDDHMHAYGPFDQSDEDEVDKVRTYLTQVMNRDFVEMDDIEPDDFIRVGGNAIFMVFDVTESDDPEYERQEQQTFMLGAHDFIEGTVEAIAIAETPSLQTIARLQDRIIDVDEPNVETDPLGVLLTLSRPVIIDEKGDRTQLGNNFTIGIVLTNPDMKLSKYLF